MCPSACMCVCAWGIACGCVDWIEDKQPTFFVIIILDLSFHRSIDKPNSTHLIVHLCFHQFQIDYLDCFSYLINAFFIRSLCIHTPAWFFHNAFARKVYPLQSSTPKKELFWSFFGFYFYISITNTNFSLISNNICIELDVCPWIETFSVTN